MRDRQRLVPAGIRRSIQLAAIWMLLAGSALVEGGYPVIRVKHILKGSIYLDAGSAAGLSVGQRLTLRRKNSRGKADADVAQMELESVASASAVGKIISSQSDVARGDYAYVVSGDEQANLQALPRKDVPPADYDSNASTGQDVRKNGSRQPRREVNRIRGRIGADFSALQLIGSGIDTSQFGFMIRMDAERLGGSYWNVRGYYRGRVQSRKSRLEGSTLTDMINRTYHLGIYYENPSSHWVAGGGRIYVPWAASLSTIDGFYAGRRLGKQTVGVFAGTTPDPSSWNYDADRQMAGAFINTERGSFESFRISSTSGLAVSRVHWSPERQFGFFENDISYKRYFSIYSNVEADFRSASQNEGKKEALLSRAYVTVRLQPHKVIAFDVSENYFRNLPTFDTRLISTGLVDRFLFQGVSGGVRLTLPHQVSVWGNTGRSSRTGDRKPSWNYLGGASVGDVLRSGVRAEYRYSRFDSSFGKGTNHSFGVAREMGAGVRFDLQAGQQDFTSGYTSQDRARFLNATVDWYLRNHYFIGGTLAVYRSQIQKYNQYFLNFGYRFDNRR